MGISHDYNYARRRARQQGAHTKLKVLLCVAAILLLSLAITAILQTAQQEAAPPQEEILPTGTVEGILAPLPMQPGEGGSGDCPGPAVRPGPAERGQLHRAGL